MDLADGHVAALNKLFSDSKIGKLYERHFKCLCTQAKIRILRMCWCVILILGCTAYNLGTGQGTSVLEMVSAFEKASGKVKLSLISAIMTVNLVRMRPKICCRKMI